jgi:hypothetical protein
MPADALFEVMAVCAAGFSLPHGRGWNARDAQQANFLQGLKPVPLGTFTQGLKPLPPKEKAPVGPSPVSDPNFRTSNVSTTEFSEFVVENRGEKGALKVLVESLLLAFCTKCRRADIFHKFTNLGALRSVSRSYWHLNRGKFRRIGILPSDSRQSPSRQFFQSNSK